MWLEPEGITLSEINQSEEDKYHMISLICGISETKQMDKGKKREQDKSRNRLNNREQTDG